MISNYPTCGSEYFNEMALISRQNSFLISVLLVLFGSISRSLLPAKVSSGVKFVMLSSKSPESVSVKLYVGKVRFATSNDAIVSFSEK